jgi:hypothetical protein
MTFRPLALLATTALIAAVGSGCPKRLDFGPKGQITDAETLLKLVGAAEAQVETVQGEAKLGVRSPQGSGSLGMYLAVARPALLHLETMDFFGRPQAVLTTNGERFGLYQASEATFYEGPASAQNLSRFLPIQLPPRELTQLMLGQVPRIPFERASLSVDEREVAYKLVLEAGEVTQTVWVDTLTFRPLKSEVRGTRAYDLTLTAEAAKTVLELRYKDVTLNDAPDPAQFEIAAPPDVPVVALDEAGNPQGPPRQGP